MAPVSPLAARDDPATMCQNSLDTYKGRTLALGLGLGMFALLAAGFIYILFGAYRRSQAAYTCIKLKHDIANSERSYFSTFADTLEGRLNRLKADLRIYEHYVGDVDRFLPQESADLADRPMGPLPTNPFVVGDDSSDSEYGDPVVTTARAQPITPVRSRQASIFSGGSSPRPLIMTPGSSWRSSSGSGSSGKSKSKSRRSSRSAAYLEPPIEMKDLIAEAKMTNIRADASLRPPVELKNLAPKATTPKGQAKFWLRPLGDAAHTPLAPSPLRQSFDHISETSVGDDVDREHENDDAGSTVSSLHTDERELHDDAYSTVSSLHSDEEETTAPRNRYQATAEDVPDSPASYEARG